MRGEREAQKQDMRDTTMSPMAASEWPYRGRTRGAPWQEGQMDRSPVSVQPSGHTHKGCVIISQPSLGEI